MGTPMLTCSEVDAHTHQPRRESTAQARGSGDRCRVLKGRIATYHGRGTGVNSCPAERVALWVTRERSTAPRLRAQSG